MIDENADDESADRNTSPNQTMTADGMRKPRGFAAMDPRLVSELAKRGGKAAHQAGTAHRFTSDEARLAGRKGGAATHAKRRTSDTQLKPS